MKIGTFKELEAALADTRDKFQTTTLSVKGLLEHAFKLFFELLAIVSGGARGSSLANQHSRLSPISSAVSIRIIWWDHTLYLAVCETVHSLTDRFCSHS